MNASHEITSALVAQDSCSVAPVLPPAVPRRSSAIGRFIGRVGFVLFDWKVSGNFPDLPKMVVIVAPHTSNWDFVTGLCAYLALDINATWFGKHTLFNWPFGALFRHFGGIPIERDSQRAATVVDLYADELDKRDAMVLAIAPEGTRKKVLEWKSGFYRIAVKAGVPIVSVGLDYATSRVIIGDPFYPTGDWELDIPKIKALFDGVTAKHPDQF